MLMPNFTMAVVLSWSVHDAAAGTRRGTVSTSGGRELASLILSFRSRISRAVHRAFVIACETRAGRSGNRIDGHSEEQRSRGGRGGVAAATWTGAHPAARAQCHI
jgi:hypothetical protein